MTGDTEGAPSGGEKGWVSICFGAVVEGCRVSLTPIASSEPVMTSGGRKASIATEASSPIRTRILFLGTRSLKVCAVYLLAAPLSRESISRTYSQIQPEVVSGSSSARSSRCVAPPLSC